MYDIIPVLLRLEEWKKEKKKPIVSCVNRSLSNRIQNRKRMTTKTRFANELESCALGTVDRQRCVCVHVNIVLSLYCVAILYISKIQVLNCFRRYLILTRLEHCESVYGPLQQTGGFCK